MKVIKNINYATEHPRQVLDLYLPEKESFKLFVYIHGGGMECGSKEEYIKLGEYLALQGFGAAVISYRIYPEAKYPEFIEDSASAVAWVYKNIAEYGNCEGIYVGGSSAGGYITQMLCFDTEWLGAQDMKPTDLAGFYHDAGQPTVHFNVLREMGIDTRRCIIDEKAPLFYIDENTQYPPMDFIVSDNDIPARYEQTQLVIATLKHFGHTENINVTLKHGTHCHYVHIKDENGFPDEAKMICQYLSQK